MKTAVPEIMQHLSHMIKHGGVMTERATVMIFCVTTPLNKKFRNSFMFAIIHFTDEVAFDQA